MAKETLEEQVKTLQKHMGAIFRTLKDLKSSVQVLEKKLPQEENKEIKEIIETQKVINEIIVANGDAIKRIDKELKKSLRTNAVAKDTSAKDSVDVEEVVSEKKRKRCRYFNRGFCKYLNKCRFVHPLDICGDYLRDDKCERRECCDRHPKRCKWDNSDKGCRRGNECLYLHTTINETEEDKGSELKEYQCQGCKYIWNDGNCMEEQVIKGIRVFFCLNCHDWIKDKPAVFEQGWTMFDGAGFLRTDV